MTRPNGRLLQAAHLLEQLAPQVTAAVEHVQRELAIADSYPRQTPGASAPTSHGEPPVCRCEPGNRVGCDVCSPVHLTATERAADQRWRLMAQREQIRDDITAIESLLASLSKVVTSTIGIRLAHDVPRCDGRGFEGAELPYTPYSQDPRNGWHRPECSDAADESGLCAACRIRERRWRVENGLAPRRSNAGNAAA